MSKSLTEHQEGRRLKCPFKLGTISPAFYAPFRVTITIVGLAHGVVEKAQPCFYRGTSAWLSRSPAASSLFPPPAGPRLQLKVKQELLRSDKW
jgi:hypothetical protein